MAEREQGGQKFTCSNCGKVQTEFWQYNGKGFLKNNQVYCCQGCADNTGCICSIPGGGG